MFKNISAGAQALGARQYGFNNEATLAAVGLIGGAYSAYDGIIVFAGTNDLNRDVQIPDTENGLRNILAHVRADNAAHNRNKKVLVIEPIYRGDEDKPNHIGATLKSYRVVEEAVCSTPPSFPPSNPETGGFSDVCFFGHRSNTVLGSRSALPYLDHDQEHPIASGQRALASWIQSEARKATFTKRNGDGSLTTIHQPLF